MVCFFVYADLLDHDEDSDDDYMDDDTASVRTTVLVRPPFNGDSISCLYDCMVNEWSVVNFGDYKQICRGLFKLCFLKILNEHGSVIEIVNESPTFLTRRAQEKASRRLPVVTEERSVPSERTVLLVRCDGGSVPAVPVQRLSGQRQPFQHRGGMSGAMLQTQYRDRRKRATDSTQNRTEFVFVSESALSCS